MGVKAVIHILNLSFRGPNMGTGVLTFTLQGRREEGYIYIGGGEEDGHIVVIATFIILVILMLTQFVSCALFFKRSLNKC